MKLIYIANIRIPTEKAHGIQTVKMCEAFANTGVRVSLIVPRRINRLKQDPFDYYDIKRTFKIKKLFCLDFIIFDKIIGHLGMWAESISFYFSVFIYINFIKADIIYTRDKLFLPFVFLRNNVAVELHSLPGHYFLYSWLIKRFKKIIVITKSLKRSLIINGVNPKNVLVTPDGVDFKKFNISLHREECRKKLGLPLDKKIVLYSGHLYKWKGVDTLAEAVNYLPKNIYFYFVGGIEGDVDNFRKKYGVTKNIKIIGHRPHGEIPYWLKSANILVLPNSNEEDISMYWTSPLKLFEYMASGTPIIASDLPSIKEILNEKNSFLTKSDNPEELAKMIAMVLQNPEISARISNQAFQDVQRFTWEKRSEEILKFINTKIDND